MLRKALKSLYPAFVYTRQTSFTRGNILRVRTRNIIPSFTGVTGHGFGGASVFVVSCIQFCCFRQCNKTRNSKVRLQGARYFEVSSPPDILLRGELL